MVSEERNNLVHKKEMERIDITIVVSNALEKERERCKAKFNEMQKENKMCEEEMKKEFDRKLSELTNKFRTTFKIVFDKLNAVKIQCNEFFAKSIKRVTKDEIIDQISKNTSDIASIQNFIGEQMKKTDEINEDDKSKSSCMPQ